MASIMDMTDPTVEPVISPGGGKRKKKTLSETAIDLAPPKRVSNPTRAEKSEKPSAKMKKRMDEREDTKSLGETLGEVAAALPAGEGWAGRFLSNIAQGAAAGATLGEYLAEKAEEKRQTGTKKAKPRTLSEKSIE